MKSIFVPRHSQIIFDLRKYYCLPKKQGDLTCEDNSKKQGDLYLRVFEVNASSEHGLLIHAFYSIAFSNYLLGI